MKKALIIYHSKHGTTKKYAEEMGQFLKELDVESTVISTSEDSGNLIGSVDIILLGCWTSGLFLFAQHPEGSWKDFAGTLPSLKDKKVGLFTTYKLATGSMFSKMKKALGTKAEEITLELKSKSQYLTSGNKEQLKEFVS